MGKKNILSAEKQRKIEKAVSREIWKEQGCPKFKGGIHTDKKKEASRRQCRQKVNQEGNSLRDPARIEPLLKKLGDFWKQHPDIRLCQLVDNIGHYTNPNKDLFYLEDEDFEEGLDILIQNQKFISAAKK